MNVLIAIDGSAGSFEALRQACHVLSPETDTLWLFYSPPMFSAAAAIDPRVIAPAQAALAVSIFDAAMPHVSQPWKSKVQRIVRSDHPASGILNSSDQSRADLIVVGARGLGPVARLVLGSVSRGVVHSSKVPVLVCRPKDDKKAPSGLRILLACESADAGTRLATVLAKFTWPEGSDCTAITVVPSILGGELPDWVKTQPHSPEIDEMIKGWAKIQATRLSEARRNLEQVCNALPKTLRHSSPIVAEGRADMEIIDQAQKHASDLIVIGAKTSSLLGRLLIGSTCEYVLNHAPCSVLVVHHAE